MRSTPGPSCARPGRPRLTSPRLVLRPADPADAALLQAHWDRPLVRRHLWDDERVTEDMVAAVLARSDADFDAAGFGAWIVEDAPTGEFLGYCGIRVVEGTDLPEVLYSLEPKHWGQGLAAEAAATVLTHAFDTLKVPRVLGGADPANAASRRVLERLGGRPIGDVVAGGRSTPYHEFTRSTWRSAAAERRTKPR